jgi:hypothetical protein
MRLPFFVRLYAIATPIFMFFALSQSCTKRDIGLRLCQDIVNKPATALAQPSFVVSLSNNKILWINNPIDPKYAFGSMVVFDTQTKHIESCTDIPLYATMIAKQEHGDTVAIANGVLNSNNQLSGFALQLYTPNPTPPTAGVTAWQATGSSIFIPGVFSPDTLRFGAQDTALVGSYNTIGGQGHVFVASVTTGATNQYSLALQTVLPDNLPNYPIVSLGTYTLGFSAPVVAGMPGNYQLWAFPQLGSQVPGVMTQPTAITPGDYLDEYRGSSILWAVSLGTLLQNNNATLPVSSVYFFPFSNIYGLTAGTYASPASIFNAGSNYTEGFTVGMSDDLLVSTSPPVVTPTTLSSVLLATKYPISTLNPSLPVLARLVNLPTGPSAVAANCGLAQTSLYTLVVTPCGIVITQASNIMQDTQTPSILYTNNLFHWNALPVFVMVNQSASQFGLNDTQVFMGALPYNGITNLSTQPVSTYYNAPTSISQSSVIANNISVDLGGISMGAYQCASQNAATQTSVWCVNYAYSSLWDWDFVPTDWQNNAYLNAFAQVFF